MAADGGSRMVVVIGGGFSGLLTALHLLARDPAVVVRLVEKADRFGVGRAYAAPNPDHLLNVRASNMSAFPERPGHFLAWLEGRGAGGDGFVSRGLYGEYLQELLRDVLGSEGHPGRLLLEHDEAVGVDARSGGLSVRLAMGRRLPADVVVLAVGLAPPPAPPGALAPGVWFDDPWSIDPAALPAGDILLIGTGLTMIDTVLGLARPDRRFTVVSRRGLTPQEHGPAPPAPLPAGPLDTPARALRSLRRHADEAGWRSAVDSIRPLTPAIWRAWDLAQRRRFLRHARPWWDVHRHRMAPQVAQRIGDLVEAGALKVEAARIVRLEPDGAGVAAILRGRGATTETRRTFAAAVNCTGLSGDLAGRPLLADLAQAGLLRPDPLGLGLDIADGFRVLGRAGDPTPGLYAVGPLTRAARWETVAVPDLRSQTAELAAVILGDLGADLGLSGVKAGAAADKIA